MAWSAAARAAAALARKKRSSIQKDLHARKSIIYANGGFPARGLFGVDRKTMAGIIKATRRLDPSLRGPGKSLAAVKLSVQRISNGRVYRVSTYMRPGKARK